MTENDLVQRVLGDYSIADLVALKKDNSEVLALWMRERTGENEGSERAIRRHTRIFDLQRLNVAIDIILRNRKKYLIELLGDFRLP